MTGNNFKTKKYTGGNAQTPLEISRSPKRSKFLTGPPARQTRLTVGQAEVGLAFSRAGQTTLEFTLCFIVLIMLFIAGFLAFKWAGQNLVKQQLDYEATRGQSNPPVDFYTPTNLDLGKKLY